MSHYLLIHFIFHVKIIEDKYTEDYNFKIIILLTNMFKKLQALLMKQLH